MHDVGVPLDDHAFGDADAPRLRDAPDVVSAEVYEHDVFGQFLLVREEFSFEGEVYVAEGDLLQRRAVMVLRSQGEEAFVSEGLQPGDLVIVTRLLNPLPGMRVDIAAPAPEASTGKTERAS